MALKGYNTGYFKAFDIRCPSASEDSSDDQDPTTPFGSGSNNIFYVIQRKQLGKILFGFDRSRYRYALSQFVNI